MALYDQITIIGLGLIGSSLALGIKEKSLTNKLIGFVVSGNHLTGPMRALPFNAMRLRAHQQGWDSSACEFFNHGVGGTNAFECPWPQGAVGFCMNITNGSLISITDDDCGPYNKCTGSSMELEPAQCDAWQDLFDSTQGNAWRFCNKLRTDPCSCRGGNSNHPGVIGPPVCDSANTTVTTM